MGVEQGRDPELLLGHSESQTVVSIHIIRIKAIVINQMRMEVVDDGAEGEATPPAGGHVKDINIDIARSDLLCPGLEGLGACDRHGEGLEITVMMYLALLCDVKMI